MKQKENKGYKQANGKAAKQAHIKRQIGRKTNREFINIKIIISLKMAEGQKRMKTPLIQKDDIVFEKKKLNKYAKQKAFHSIKFL